MYFGNKVNIIKDKKRNKVKLVDFIMCNLISLLFFILEEHKVTPYKLSKCVYKNFYAQI